jgi:hypothetical protein
MKTALQEIFEYWNTQNNPLVILNWIASNEKRLLEKEKEQIKNVFEHCWNHQNWNGEYDIKDMEDYLKNYNQNK